jgi:hypothetical protein
MIQAARSGKQNLIEGSLASGASKEMEIKLTNVARANLEELDYRDFMRHHKIEEWDKNHRYARRWGNCAAKPDANCETFKKGIEHADPAISTNAIVGLIQVTSLLLKQQLKKPEPDFRAKAACANA